MSIRKLTKEENRKYRRQFLADVAYIMFHDTLRRWHSEGKTSLTDVEITLAANDFCHVVLSLPDAEEGLPYEMDYLEEDAESQTDAMLIMMVATAMLRAWGTHHIGTPTKNLISTIYERWADEDEALRLLSEASSKEESRWQQGKPTLLTDYELQELEQAEGCERIDSLLDDLQSPTYGKSVDTIKEMLLALGKYNIKHGHALDEHLLRMYAQLDGANSLSVGDNKGFVVNGNVNTKLELSNEQLASFMQAQGKNLITNN